MASSSRSSGSSRVNLFSSSPELLQSDDSLPPFSPVAVFDDSPPPSRTSHRPPENAHIETIHGVEYVHFRSIYYESFLDWWKYTPIGRKCISGKIDEKFQHPRWNKCRGDLWKHFVQLAEVHTGRPVLQCQACGKIIQHGIFTKNGASGMKKHLNTKDCKSLQSRDSKQSVLQWETRKTSSKRPYSAIANDILPPKTDEYITEYILKAIISLNLSFRAIDNPALVDLLRLLDPNISFPRRTKLRSFLDTRFETVKQKLLAGKPKQTAISVTLDTWTSPNHLGFLGIVGSFINSRWERKEVLLGFEPLSGAHTGSALAAVVQKTLYDYDIESHLLAITADNASNNRTLCQVLSEKLESKGIQWSAKQNQLPCLAHVVQLIVNEIIKHLSIGARDDVAAVSFSDDDIRPALSEYSVSFGKTLHKIRLLANAINASPQRRERFCDLQTRNPPLQMVQDVRTRWNSTFAMAIRALLLKDVLTQFLDQTDNTKLQELYLTPDEWKQVQYVIVILFPFWQYTQAISISRDISIHHAWQIYNKLFQHLESRSREAERERTWKEPLVKALQAAKDRLSDYYSQTDNEFGIFYAVTTILDPSKRMNAFHEDDWTKDERKFQKQRILQFYQDNYQEYEPLRTQLEEEGDLSPMEDLNTLFSRTSKPTSKDTGTCNEIERYLSEQPLSDSNIDILSQWRSIEAVYPTVARMARDLLAVFLTSLPVERQFNVGRDTCTYRRGKLQGETIRKIMILKHSDKDLIDPGLLDDCQLAEWEDEEIHHKNETSIARKATFDEKVLAAPLRFDHAAADEDVGGEPPAERTRKRHQRRWS